VSIDPESRRVRRIRLDAAARDAFLADRRLGILALHDGSGAPVGVPLWYGWDGVEIEMFSERRSRTVLRLGQDPRASLLVANIPPEPARWVSLAGRVVIDPGLGQEAAARLAARYLLDPRAVAAAIGRLRNGDLVRLSFVPERIRSYAEI
jgi:nitroimidazol reductase NimA-like FMN-containing flavoprotein (pyridoxamine 5'-phosphate oxidase superfamily)